MLKALVGSFAASLAALFLSAASASAQAQNQVSQIVVGVVGLLLHCEPSRFCTFVTS